MRRLLPAVALGGLLALLAVGLVLALRPGVEPSAAERTDALARELRCPDCQGLSVADSPTSSAQEIRRQISELVAAGAGDEEVRAHFVARYGQWILLAPSSVAYWLIPFVVVAAAAAGLVAWLARQRPAVADSVALSNEQRRSLHEEVEALDA
ncbi:MAG: cytochrome c-type biogenesis protein CcmH [Candidatus Limnocylindria bacterium]